MMIQFVERKRDPDGERSFNRWILLLVGLLIINGMTLVFIPLSIFVSKNISAAFLIIIFILAFFACIRYSYKFSYGTIYALFLSIIGATVSFLYLGEFVSLISGNLVKKNVSITDNLQYNSKKIIYFSNGKFLEDYSNQLLGVVQPKVSRLQTTKPIYFQVTPFVEDSWKHGDPIRIWFVCNDAGMKDCLLNKGYRTGMLISEPDPLKNYIKAIEITKEKFGLTLHKNIHIIRWVKNPEYGILQTSFFATLVVLGLNIFWMLSVFIYYLIS
jgi:hypothetical protein